MTLMRLAPAAIHTEEEEEEEERRYSKRKERTCQLADFWSLNLWRLPKSEPPKSASLDLQT